MARFKSKLDNVRVAAPCNVDWDTMYGNERVRFCDQCQLNVYNLSEMTKSEAERLIGNAEGRLCVRYYRRGDGSILTQNCPLGFRALKRRMSRIATAVASIPLSFLVGLGIDRLFSRTAFQPQPLMGALPAVVPEPLPPTLPAELGAMMPIKERAPVRRHKRR